MTTDSDNILLSYQEAAESERTTVDAIKVRVHRGRMKAERSGGHPRIPITELSPTAQKRAREIIAAKQAA